jgi:hypothetical protein
LGDGYASLAIGRAVQQNSNTLGCGSVLRIRELGPNRTGGRSELDWEALGALGEIIGAAGVVISLVYLARQIKMSNRLAQAEAWRNAISGVTTLAAAFGVDPRFDQLMARVMQGEDVATFDADDAATVSAYMISVANIYEQIYREVREGVLDHRALDEFFAGRLLFDTRFFRTRWVDDGLRYYFGKPFADWAERIHDLRSSASSEGAPADHSAS